jgi:hypothetical protein
MGKTNITNINLLEEQANRLVLLRSCYIQIASESECGKLSEKIKNQLIKWGICIVDLQHDNRVAGALIVAAHYNLINRCAKDSVANNNNSIPPL